eukprot:jgi/Ulvmu1/8797/UM048_0052.1
MDWEQVQPQPQPHQSLALNEPELSSCRVPVTYHLLAHAVSFAVGSATTAYCLRWQNRAPTHPKVVNKPIDPIDEGISGPLDVRDNGYAAGRASSSTQSAMPSSAPPRVVPSQCALRSTGGTECTELVRSDASSMSLAPGGVLGELDVALQDPTLAAIVDRAEYSGSRSANRSAELLLQIALDAPARWTAADYEFVTHCKCLVSLADHEDVRLQTASERIERLQNDIWKYIKLQLKRSEVGIQARDDKRKHSLACSTELQVDVRNAYLLLMLGLCASLAWCFRLQWQRAWHQSLRGLRDHPSVVCSKGMWTCVRHSTPVILRFGRILLSSVPDVPALIGAGSILYGGLYLISGPLSALSSHAASGNVAAATLLCGLWWHLSHTVIATASPHLPRFYGGLCTWVAAYCALMCQERSSSSELISRGAGMAIIRTVLAVAPAVTVWACMS